MTIPKIKFKYPSYIVGGWCRDYLLNVPSKDIDVCMVAPSFKDMEDAIKEAGGEIFLSTPQYLTIRCKIPNLGDVDVAMARKDGEYSDGRRPETTEIADSIESDLSRRDFRINAIALDLENGKVIDPFGGQQDIQDRLIRTVGNSKDRFEEDYLRLVRALRFLITKRFDFDEDVEQCLKNPDICAGLEKISAERIREELVKAFKFDTMSTVHYLSSYQHILYWCVNKGIWFKPTMEKK